MINITIIGSNTNIKNRSDILNVESIFTCYFGSKKLKKRLNNINMILPIHLNNANL